MLSNKIYAFFDVDGTLINFNTMKNFLNYFFNVYFEPGEAYRKKAEYEDSLQSAFSLPREQLNLLYYKNFTGIKESILRSISFDWFNKITSIQDVFHQNILRELRSHQENNHTVVFVSGGFFATLSPIAQYLDVEHVLCVAPIVKDGILTGKINLNCQTIGEGKKTAIQKFIHERHPNSIEILQKCYAYGDHISDYHMLCMVGNPYIIGNDKDLNNIAIKNHWNILN